MSHIVRLVVGDWQQVGQGAWQFNYDNTHFSHDIVVRENETYASLLRMVRTKYHLDEILLPSDPVLLTYDFSDLSRDPTSYTSPLVEVKEDGYVELFISVRIEYAWLELYVTFGEGDVGCYRCQRNEEDGITMGVADRSEINIMEVEDYRETGFILVSERVLEEICMQDELEMISTASYALAPVLPPLLR